MLMEVTTEIASLAGRVNAGDSCALEELIAELRPQVVQTVRLVVGSGSWVAEDAAQEALLDIGRGISKLREPAAVRAWALRIATRSALKAARRERVLRWRGVDDADELSAAPSAEGRKVALKQAFDRLPPRLRVTAVLRLHVGLSETETAAVLDCSVGTVKSNLHDARKRLTEMLTEAGYAPAVQQHKGELR